MQTLQDHKEKANQLSLKYKGLVVNVYSSEFGNKPFIEVSSIEKAKAASEMFQGYNFSSGPYKS